MGWQAFPFWSQICHWYVKAIGSAPDQVPFWAVAVLPLVSEPVIVGATLLVGPPAPIAALWLLIADLEPSAFVAVTCIRSVFPLSPVAIRYVCEVAPTIGWQAFPF
jgi:hypothetical protein